jgi:GH25 family lysozyme M1 (1,4-beta-N-acetylmuramidase)
MEGIDISQYQKGIDFDSIKNQYDFVILRGGYTGYGSTRPLVKDECFEEFYKACKDRGIPVGVYWYSCANSKKFGKMEASFLYDNCLKGKKFQYPVYIDVEDVH